MATKSKAVASGDSCNGKGKENSTKKDGKSNKHASSPSSPEIKASEASGKKKLKTDFGRPIRKFREGLGQALSSLGDGIKPKQDRPPEGVNKEPERAGKVRTLLNGIGLVFYGIKFVVTKPHELLYAALRRLIPSISTGQLNFLLIVLLVVFAWSIRSDTSRMHDSTIDIQKETQQDVKTLRDEIVKQREKQESYAAAFQDAVATLAGVAEATKNGVAKVAEATRERVAKVAAKASEFAGGAANFVGETYYSWKNWLWYESAGNTTTDQL